MNLDNFSPEQIEKLKEMSATKIVEYAKNEGVELTDEQLDAVSGGTWGFSDYEGICPDCKKHFYFEKDRVPKYCPYCGAGWHMGTEI